MWSLVFRLNPPGRVNRVPEECRTILERIVAADLTISHFFSRDQDEVFISVGAVEDVLVDEATHHMPIPMQLKKCDPESGTLSVDGRLMRGTYPFHGSVPRENYKFATPTRLFNSGAQQRLVMNRITRFAGDVADRIVSVPREKQLQIAESYAKAGKRMQVFAVKKLVEAYGCSGGDTEVAKQVRLRLPKASEAHTRWSEMLPSVKEDAAVILDVCAELRKREEDDQDDQTDSWVTSGSLQHCYPVHFPDELELLKGSWGSLSLAFKPGIYTEEDPYTGNVVKWFAPHFQPIDQVRDYFGEHVALYFAWLGLYTRYLTYPMLLGMLTMIGYQIPGWGTDNNRFALAYSVFLSLWSTLFLESWTRYENELKFRWGSEGFEATEEPRPQFRGMLEQNPETGITKMVHKKGVSFYKRQGRITVSWTMSFAMILATVTAAINAYLVREIGRGGVRNVTAIVHFHPVNITGLGDQILRVDEENHCTPYSWQSERQQNENGKDMYFITNEGATTASDLGALRCVNGALGWPRTECPKHGEMFTEIQGCSMPTGFQKNKYKWGSSLVSLVCIQLASRTYKPMAVKLTDWENHRTQTEYDDSLVVKNFMFEFINNYFTLFFIAFLMGNIDIPFHGLWSYLSRVVLKEGLFPDEMTPCQNNEGETMSSCMGILQRQLLIVFTLKQLASLVKQSVKPKLATRGRVNKENAEIIQKNQLRAEGHKYPLEIENQFESEKFLVPYESNFDDFKEMSIQFGYATLFAVSYPLAATFAWINNLIEMRLDAYQLCNMHRRAHWRQQEDIGSWAAVFQMISVINVMTNACLVGFVGSQVARMVEPDNPEVTDSFMGRFTMWQMWVVVVLAEHGAFSMKFLIKFVAPSVPEWIDGAREYIQIRSGTDLKIDPTKSTTKLQLKQLPPRPKPRPRSATISNPLGHGSVPASAAQGVTKTAVEVEQAEEAKLQELWKTVDTDGSGLLNADEVRAVMKQMGKDLSDAEFNDAVRGHPHTILVVHVK